jgi:(4-(4-[2-(gamma-L-glutamylamino)ethyl]phenoxymethyl)furan-2-yl)methanamine synthase
MVAVIGWDIGGAHLKAARVEDGRILDVMQAPCPLWLGLDRLGAALDAARQRLGPADLHVATMTGELADIFSDRSAGVRAIAAALSDAVAPATLRVYAGRAGFVAPDAAAGRADDIASANWHATAALVARRRPDALLVDIGSTTTDLVPVVAGSVAASGYTDAERLARGELVYTGLTRSFAMALASRAPFAGAWTPLACEHFATSADIHRIVGDLPEEADQMPSADGREKTVAASRARLARMIGRDAADASDEAWRDLAAWFAEAQLRQITDGALLVQSRARLPDGAPIVAAGVGRHIAARLASRIGRDCTGFAELVGAGETASDWAGHCAPAVAVALLWRQEAGGRAATPA